MGVFKKARGVASRCVRKVAAFGAAAFAAGALIVSDASAQVTLPDLGVDVNGTATAMGTDLGAGFMTILGISTVFIIGSILWRWLRRAKG
ncbi:MAG: hypothetical protein AAF726_17915 [Planctomycetota bacterium]